MLLDMIWGLGACPRAFSSSVLLMSTLEWLLRAPSNWSGDALWGSLRTINWDELHSHVHSDILKLPQAMPATRYSYLYLSEIPMVSHLKGDRTQSKQDLTDHVNNSKNLFPKSNQKFLCLSVTCSNWHFQKVHSGCCDVTPPSHQHFLSVSPWPPPPILPWVWQIPRTSILSFHRDLQWLSHSTVYIFIGSPFLSLSSLFSGRGLKHDTPNYATLAHW